MIQPNQLLLIPRRLGMLRPGIHRVVFTDPEATSISCSSQK